MAKEPKIQEPKKVIKKEDNAVSSTISSKPKKKKDKKVIKPDGWGIETKKDEKYLVFYKDEKPVVEIPFEDELFRSILEEINNNVFAPINIADKWTYRHPIDKNMPDVLTLISEGKILGTLPIDRKVALKLMPELEHYQKPLNIFQRFSKLKKQSIVRYALTMLVIVIIVGVLLYSGYQLFMANAMNIVS